MDKLFDSHWVLRITALILAILLFIYVKAQMDDGKNTGPNVEMDIITAVPLEAYYDTENLIVTGLPKTVDVTLEGPVQLVLQAKLKRDFKVFVDLSELLIGKHTVTIQTENFSEKLEVSIDPKIVDIVIEEKVTEEVRIEPEMNNRLIAEGFIISNMSADPGTVFVTGAKSVIEDISYVKATVSAEGGLKSSFEQEAAVKVLDSNLNKLDVTIDRETVKVKVDIKEYSRKVPLLIRQKGTPIEGVRVNNLTSNTETIEVFGPKSIIDSLTELVVEFDISEIQQSGSYDVQLNVPNGATRLSTEKVKVNANITKTTVNTEEEPPVEDNTEETNTDETNPEDETTQNGE
ncbi:MULTISPECIES: YbbR-like domain-containing protein [Lysinibacillus]|uniref:YbbR-like domain-containing protein n=1 Tax=Lysinibacillus antri TaxID=2498145 RepID=A0A3S0RW03_9BACI|nr:MULTISPECIES: CdaR family protein [Lysinibacillus]RUL53526.1 hypothetical protein EK386_08130 [Lysinibacillus antri]TSI06245.1 hypothetical protein FJQ64_10980 [Lysinibacillus sp. BW-2-10]